jgi:hypothetical protein
MSTAGDLLLAAYQQIGYYATSETMTGADTSRGLDQFNKLLDSWSNETSACFCITENSFPLVVNQISYTIGPGGNINVARPLKLIEGRGAAYVQDFEGNNTDVEIVTRQDWNSIGNRTTTTNSNTPDTIFYDPQMPLGIINVYPAPNIGYTMFFDSYSQLADVSNVATQLDLPPGYELALQSNLAVLLGTFVKNAPVSPDVKEIARETKAIIKRTNHRMNTVRFDPGVSTGNGGGYNIYTDDYNRH